MTDGVFSMKTEIGYVPACTVSGSILKGNGTFITLFSLAPNTNISEEIYLHPMLWKMEDGEAEVFSGKEILARIKGGDSYAVVNHMPVGIRTQSGCKYTELIFQSGTRTEREEKNMNDILKTGEIFKLKDILPYQDGKVVNMDLVDDEHVKFVLLSFDKGQELPEHAAPGDAMVFCLEGEGIIGQGGQEYHIHEGENFRFMKGGSHYVKAVSRYKMALVLIRD